MEVPSISNCLSDLGSLDMEAISVTFRDYHKQRREHVRNQYNSSLLTLSSSLAKLLRFVVFNLLLKSLMDKERLKEGAYRPQVTLSPKVPG
ncbi:MAG: hypothetical protein BYD32DRAFT_461179 [Podila humilis]|nr:MAG: hypothetical protein BYD32DRAFT_461179 [Podila humilis]